MEVYYLNWALLILKKTVTKTIIRASSNFIVLMQKNDNDILVE